jgi:hypothetical protein
VQQDAVHVNGFSVAGVTQKGPAEPGPGAGEILLSGAKLAPGNERLNLRGVEGECSSEVRLSQFRSALLALENRKVDPAGNEVWTQLDGAIECRGRPSILPAVAKQAAEADPDSREVRTQGERAAVTCFSFMKPAKASQSESGGVLGLRQARLKSESPLVAFEGLDVAILKGESVAQAEMRADQRWLVLERELKFASCLVAMAVGDAQLTEAGMRESTRAVEPDGLLVSDIRLNTAALGVQSLAQGDPCRALQG